MNFQRLECYEKAALEASLHYSQRQVWNVSLLHLSENATFLLTEVSNLMDKRVMRVSRIGYHSRSEIEAETEWLLRLGQSDTVRTVCPIPNDEGKLLTQVEEEGQVYICIVFWHLEGKLLDPKRDPCAMEDFCQIGRIAALLHKDVLQWKESSQLLRPHWNYENMIGVHGLFGDWRTCRDLNSREIDMLEGTCCQIRRRLEEYGRSEQNYGLIHADLRAANLRKDGSVIQVMDFDDCGFGWHLYDLAASMSFIEDDPRLRQWTEAWLKGYETVRPLRNRDLQEIPTFMMARRIQLLAWLTSHEDSDPVKERYPGFAKDTVRLAREYEQQLYRNKV